MTIPRMMRPFHHLSPDRDDYKNVPPTDAPTHFTPDKSQCHFLLQERKISTCAELTGCYMLLKAQFCNFLREERYYIILFVDCVLS